MKVGEVECCEDLQESNQNKRHHNSSKIKKPRNLGLFFLSTKRKSIIAFSILFKLTLT